MEKISNYRVYIDGIDKTGKSLICDYIAKLSNFKYLVKDRGLISMIAYSDIYNRHYEYDINEDATINVLLIVDKEDWKIRCKMTNEKDVKVEDYEKHFAAFLSARKKLIEKGYVVPIYNTSKYAPYEIAKEIIKFIEKSKGE